MAPCSQMHFITWNVYENSARIVLNRKGFSEAAAAGNVCISTA